MRIAPPRVAIGMTTGTWIAVLAVLIALGFGGYRALTDGRFRLRGRAAKPSAGSAETNVDTTGGDSVWATVAGPAGVEPGERATLVQFSSAFCAPCRATRRVLTDVASTVPGVVHVEIDAEHHLDVVRRLNVLRTPTTLILDAGGNEVARASGAPRTQQVLDVLLPF